MDQQDSFVFFISHLFSLFNSGEFKFLHLWNFCIFGQVRLQLEALVFEKSRLANENANLTRENQCLHQLVEYHQLTSQDLSPTPSYEHVVRGMCLDFSSPPSAIPEEEEEEEREGEDGNEVPRLPQRDFLELCNSVDEFYDEEQQHEVQEDF